ncbi:MAG: histidine kinase [Tenuifilaceae bacterium]
MKILHLKNRLYLFAKRKVVITIFVITLFSVCTYAQNPEPVFRKYTVDNGLPSSTIYHVFQDSKGYMWFATANGVSRFNGYKFENFDLQSGLVDNDVFEIYEDYKQRIWFIPMSGKLAYYENGKITSFKYNNQIKDHLPRSRGPVKCSFFVDSLDYIYLSLKQFGLISISPEGVYKTFDKENSDYNLKIDQLPNGKTLISNHKNPMNKYVEFHGLFQNFKFSLNLFENNKQYVHHHLFFFSTPDSSIICSLFRTLHKIKNGELICNKKFDEDIIWMSIDDNNNLWVAPQGGGIQCYTNFDFNKEPQTTFLRNYQISSVVKDSEGAYWFSSLNDGVFYCSDINFLNYTIENGLADNRVNALSSLNNELYIGYDFGFIDILKDKGIEHYSIDNIAYKPSVRSMTIDQENNRVWACAIDNLYWIKNSNLYSLDKLGFSLKMFPRKLIKSRNGGYWIGGTRGLIRYIDNIITYNSSDNNEFIGVVFDLVEDFNGDIWFCTVNGLWKYSNGTYQFHGTDNTMLSQTGYSIFQNPTDSSLWIGTNGAGIVVKGKDSTYQITKKDGLISNSIHQLHYTHNNIWVATRQGLSRITNDYGKLTILNFTNANGLPTNEVTSVYEVNNKVYVGTAKGLTVFDKDKIIESKTAPRVIISKFRVNNEQIDLSLKKIELKHTQNSLIFDFVGFVYRKEGNINYRYRMLGADTTWIQSQTPNCLYSGLSNGDYQFEVIAQSNSGIWSDKPASVSFKILPPLWQRTWFLIIGTIFFSTFLFFVYRIRVNTIHRSNELLNNINQYKQQSLRQQMNPHFIFNTLNSIQLYILEKDPISSHKYLTKFARLMRMTLDNSLNSTITLGDEIEALRIYLDLEKLRLEEKFVYEIDLGDNQSILNFKIPTLLIQPFVENAIWHGIMLKEDQSGWVRIKLEDQDDIIICTISDNGVGRVHANKIRKDKKKEHKSRGSQITQQRIDLLNSMYQEKFNIRYEDLYDDNGTAMGTVVHISIPKEITISNGRTFSQKNPNK